MFLFDKKTKNVIKYVWGFFAILIALSMIITFSGFTMLAGTTQDAPIELTDEQIAQLREQALLQQQLAASSSLDNSEVMVEEPVIERSTPAEPPVEKLELTI